MRFWTFFLWFCALSFLTGGAPFAGIVAFGLGCWTLAIYLENKQKEAHRGPNGH
jgi:hypothetical protein